jgi:hypothetical protein
MRYLSQEDSHMATPSIYTLGQLKAYLASRTAHIEGLGDNADIIQTARADAFKDVLAHIDAIEAHDALLLRAATEIKQGLNDPATGDSVVARLAAGESPLTVAASMGPAVAEAVSQGANVLPWQQVALQGASDDNA